MDRFHLSLCSSGLMLCILFGFSCSNKQNIEAETPEEGYVARFARTEFTRCGSLSGDPKIICNNCRDSGGRFFIDPDSDDLNPDCDCGAWRKLAGVDANLGEQVVAIGGRLIGADVSLVECVDETCPQDQITNRANCATSFGSEEAREMCQSCFDDGQQFFDCEYSLENRTRRCGSFSEADPEIGGADDDLPGGGGQELPECGRGLICKSEPMRGWESHCRDRDWGTEYYCCAEGREFNADRSACIDPEVGANNLPLCGDGLFCTGWHVPQGYETRCIGGGGSVMYCCPNGETLNPDKTQCLGGAEQAPDNTAAKTTCDGKIDDITATNGRSHCADYETTECKQAYSLSATLARSVRTRCEECLDDDHGTRTWVPGRRTCCSNNYTTESDDRFDGSCGCSSIQRKVFISSSMPRSKNWDGTGWVCVGKYECGSKGYRKPDNTCYCTDGTVLDNGTCHNDDDQGTIGGGGDDQTAANDPDLTNAAYRTRYNSCLTRVDQNPVLPGRPVDVCPNPGTCTTYLDTWGSCAMIAANKWDLFKAVPKNECEFMKFRDYCCVGVFLSNSSNYLNADQKCFYCGHGCSR